MKQLTSKLVQSKNALSVHFRDFPAQFIGAFDVGSSLVDGSVKGDVDSSEGRVLDDEVYSSLLNHSVYIIRALLACLLLDNAALNDGELNGGDVWYGLLGLIVFAHLESEVMVSFR